jgi:hypothetical protein
MSTYDDENPRGGLTRRTFLTGCAAMSATRTVGAQSTFESIPLIDTHIHLIDLKAYKWIRRASNQPSLA